MYKTGILLTVAVVIMAGTLAAADKLTAEQAGEIGSPEGKVAFLREDGVWYVEIGTGLHEHVCDVTNAEGRLSWSPDNRKIAFTRRGIAQFQSPATGEGGQHRLYDIFIAYLDSAYTNNRLFWRRITDDFGSRDPEWLPDGRIVYFKDLNSYKVAVGYPNYQVCILDSDSAAEPQILRKDYANPGQEFLRFPSLSKDGHLACTFFKDLKDVGMLSIGPDEYMKSMTELHERAGKNTLAMGPAWSPDGKWIAFIGLDPASHGLYIAPPDLSTRYLVFQPPPNVYLYTYAPSFSPDSKWLTFSTDDGSIWICDITGNGARRLSGPGTNRAPAWSK